MSFAPAGDIEWTEAQPNRPLTRGDRLWTDRGSRAEIQVGSSAVRLDGQTRLDILALDDRSAQLSITQGTVYARVRSLPDGENFEIDTPNLAYRAAYPGDYRIDVDAVQGTTRVTVHSGTGTVYGESGQAQPLGGGQQVTFRGRALAQIGAQESPPQDAFDRWAAERNRREDQSIAARYVPREVVGYQQLDPHGQWRRDATHGAIWFPEGTPAGWAPYRNGRWEWIGPWGWTWIDDAPWGFAPFHYGRWALVEGRWAWAPGRLSLRPVYAPALVAFIGGGGSAVTWFALAPGEAWQPPYRTSPAYLSDVNPNIPATVASNYAYQRRPEALTAVSAADFHRGRPAGAGWMRVATNVLTSAPIVPPPPMPQERPRRAATVVARPGPTPTAAPPGQVIAQAPPPAAAVAPAASAPALGAAPRAPAPAAAVGATVARAPASPEPSGPVRRAQNRAAVAAPKPLPDRARMARAEQAKRAAVAAARQERERREQLAGRQEQARRDQIARRAEAERLRRTAQARRDEQLRRQAQARRDEQARLEAKARQAEQLRREVRASQVEQARRAADRDAVALREQRAQRDEQARRVAHDREAAQREAWQREQQALTEQWRREHEAVQRQRQRARPDLRDQPPARAPDVWQRGYPLVSPSRTS
ncbi:DUF6600 domain-containing protein [Ramlibacter sp.]|uniref:DUF6600 domain-containing protein n=1 Tax=Ramlibacter sp. TaxID=1917967 RepID=UPI002BA125FB|nr:DUF6600 domain-containing protein [Ramlibacter sp.]HWI84393.1 DUF6600 domain-containing protein [Ramlibacter sp.]